MYYHYLLLTTITTISSVTAVAIPANQNQLHTPSFATVPIKIPTGAPNAIREFPNLYYACCVF